MILYQNDAIGFRHAVDRNTLVGEIEHAYVKQMGRSVGASEKHSWNNSLRFMERRYETLWFLTTAGF
jgi:hypothetical protein